MSRNLTCIFSLVAEVSVGAGLFRGVVGLGMGVGFEGMGKRSSIKKSVCLRLTLEKRNGRFSSSILQPIGWQANRTVEVLCQG